MVQVVQTLNTPLSVQIACLCKLCKLCNINENDSTILHVIVKDSDSEIIIKSNCTANNFLFDETNDINIVSCSILSNILSKQLVHSTCIIDNRSVSYLFF